MLLSKGVNSWSIVSLLRGRGICAVALLTILSCSTESMKGHSVTGSAPTSQVDASADMRGTPQRVRLITKDQYVNSVTYIFGPDLRVDARFAPISRVDGLLEDGAASAGVTAAQLEQYQRTAALVSALVVDAQHRDFLVPCQPKNLNAADTDCATKTLSRAGRFLYRRRLSSEQLRLFVGQADRAAKELKDFYSGVAVAFEGMMESPNFLYIIDVYEPDPAHKGKLRLDAYSLAQRLSFFLWNAAPDEGLLTAAESGELQTPAGLKNALDRMLASPRLEIGMRAFFDDMMDFEEMETLAKDPKVYPSFAGVAYADAREETLRTIINHLLREKRDYRDLYTTRETFISPSLAVLYGAEAGDGWRPYEFPQDSARAGIETQISFLAAHAHAGRSSPTRRGKALRELLLCQKVPSPPANVDFSALENPRADQHTQRDRVAFHLKNPVCAGCHRLTDPIGLSMELFDGAGVHRTEERGAPIDASGSLDGKSFKDAAGLAYALHDHPALTSCLVKRLFSYGSGGPTSAEDAPTLAYFNQRFAVEGYRLPDLLRTIVLSPAFSEIIVPASVDALGKTAGLQKITEKAP
jgi:hypothetical protein